MKQFHSNEAVCECRYQVNCSMGNEEVERNIFDYVSSEYERWRLPVVPVVLVDPFWVDSSHF